MVSQKREINYKSLKGNYKLTWYFSALMLKQHYQ